jgi:hypothetical protein
MKIWSGGLDLAGPSKQIGGTNADGSINFFPVHSKIDYKTGFMGYPDDYMGDTRKYFAILTVQ